MANGRPGDAPWTDFFNHGRDVFPEDIAKMLLAIHAASPALIQHLNHPDMWEWEAGRQLDEGREKLRQIMSEHNIQLEE